jgi:hypothetical protein
MAKPINPNNEAIDQFENLTFKSLSVIDNNFKKTLI